jgi:hypothetical protein
MRTVEGKHIAVHEMNIYFSHVTAMLLEHYDTEEHAGKVFILGSYVKVPVLKLRDLYPGRKLVIYQLEQLVGGANNWHPVARTIDNMRGADEIWEYDGLNGVFLGWHGLAYTRLVPMRHARALERSILQRRSATPIDIDILFYGFVNERRARILQRLQNLFYGKVRLLSAFGLFGDELDALIARSKVILNLHSLEPYHRQEQVRIFYPLLNGLCVLSEKSQVNYFGGSVLEFGEADLKQRVEEALDTWLSYSGERFEAATLKPAAYERTVLKYMQLCERARG